MNTAQAAVVREFLADREGDAALEAQQKRIAQLINFDPYERRNGLPFRRARADFEQFAAGIFNRFERYMQV